MQDHFVIAEHKQQKVWLLSLAILLHRHWWSLSVLLMSADQVYLGCTDNHKCRRMLLSSILVNTSGFHLSELLHRHTRF